MTEIEEIVKLMLPELLLYFKSEKISDFVQKGLDKIEIPSICVIKKGTRNGRRKSASA